RKTDRDEPGSHPDGRRLRVFATDETVWDVDPVLHSALGQDPGSRVAHAALRATGPATHAGDRARTPPPRGQFAPKAASGRGGKRAGTLGDASTLTDRLVNPSSQ